MPETAARPASTNTRTYDGVPDDCPLTARQLEIVRLAVRGESYAQIAKRLHLTPSTVDTHMHAARVRLGVTGHGSRGKLCVLVLARGWLRDPNELLPSWTGPEYTTGVRRPWLPSPAERLYLDAYDELLRTRDASAARDTRIYHGLLWHIRRKPPAPPRGRDIDAMFRALGADICTPQQRRLLRHF